MLSFVEAACGLVCRIARAVASSGAVKRAIWVAPMLALILALGAAPGAAQAQATCTIDFSVSYNASNFNHVMSMTQNFDEFASCDPQYVANPGNPASGFAPYTQSGVTANGGSFTTIVNADDNTIRYTAPAGFAGTDTFTVYFCNDGACSTAARRVAAVAVTVGSPTIDISPATLVEATVGASYNQILTGSGGRAPYGPFVRTSGALPPGLVVSASGVIGGTPTASGTFNFTIRTTDSSVGNGPFNGSRAYTLTVAAPPVTVTALSPSSGYLFQTPSVTISGTGFTGATAVNFIGGGASAASFTVVNDTTITAAAPERGAGVTAEVRVTTPAGTSANAGSADDFRYIGRGVVTGVSPAQGPASGGQTVTLTGQNFTGATQVTFLIPAGMGSNFALTTNSFTVTSDTSMTVVVPGSSGLAVNGATASIIVTNPSGEPDPSAGSEDDYVYLAPPTVASVSPSTGSTAGGSAVSLTGTGFTGTTAVTFGGTPAINVTVVNATTVTATAPAHAAGTVSVAVTAQGGTATLDSAFTYVSPAPTIITISPNEGSGASPAAVTIQGTNFSATGNNVTFGGVAGSVTAQSPSSITVVPPSNAAGGLVNVVVTNASSQSATAANAYRYLLPPTVTVNFSPPSTSGITVFTVTVTNPNGVALQNVRVASNGANTPFTLTAFGGTCGSGNYNASSSFSLNGFTLAANASCTTNPTQQAATAGTFQFVTNAPTSTGTAATAVALTGAPATSNAITVQLTPFIGSVSPTSGPQAGGTTVTLNGSNFTGVTSVTFGGVAATSVTVVSNTILTAVAPQSPTSGLVAIQVTNDAGTATRNNVFTYVAAPTVTSISPTAGPTTGATAVVITGTGFTSATAVTFGATAATGFTVNSATQITATAPAGTGTVDVRITNAGGTSAASAADRYTYVAAPTVTSISPTAGPTTGATAVVITGTGFTSATAVTFGATAATGFTVNSATQITATAPAGTGTVDVRITNAGGTSAASAADRYTYVAAPAAPVFTSPANGAVVTIASPVFSGTTLAGTSVSIYVDGAFAGAAAVTGTTWTYAPAALADGSHAAYAVATGVGGSSGTSNVNTFIIDTTAPTAPVITAPINGATTSNTTPTISGTTEANAIVTVTVDGATAGTAMASGSGNWSFATMALADGTHTASATATDEGGNISPSSAAVTFTIDASAPMGPVITAPINGSITSDSTPTLSGTAESGSTVTVIVDGAVAGTVVADGSGAWSLTTASLAEGTHTASATATDAAGNVSPASPTVTFTYSPVTIANTSLPSGQVGVAYAASIQVSGGTAPYDFVVTSGALPNGVTMSSGGTLAGSPTASGSFAFTVTATDANGLSASQVYSVTITAPAAPEADPETVQITAASAGGPTTIDLSGSVDNAAAIEIVSPPSSGTATVDGFDVSYTPQPGFYGTVSFSYRAIGFADGGPGAASAPATVTITIAAPTLALAGGSQPNGQIGVAYSQVLTASGGTAPYTYAVTGGALPTGITLATDGTLAGSPTAGGTFSFTVTATDSSTGTGPFSVSAVYGLAIDGPALSITPSALPDATTAEPYSQSFSTTGGVAPYQYAITAGALPTGLTLSSAGVLSGTPTQGGSFAFTVSATDASTGAGPYTVSRSMTLTAAASTIAVTPASLPAGTRGTAYTADMAASGGVAPYSYTIASGALPAGLTLSTTGRISGTPTVVGTFAFQVRATDSATGAGPYAGVADVTLTIGSASLAVTPASLPDVLAGVPYSQQLQATGGQGSYRFAVTSGALPQGLTLSPAGLLSGRPTTAGTFAFTVTATDAFGNTGVAPLNVTVTGRPDPSADPDVRGLNAAQAEATRRMVGTQVSNFNRRLEQLHRGDEGQAAASMVLTLDGSAFTPLEERRRALGDLAQAPGREGAVDLDLSGRDELNRLVWGDRAKSTLGNGGSQTGTPNGGLNAGPAVGRGSGAPSGPRIWAGGAISLGERDATTQTAEMSITTSGISAGIDMSVADNLDLGVGVGFGQENTDVGLESSRMEADSRVAVAYGSWRPAQNVFIDGTLGYGELGFDMRRRTPVDQSLVFGQRDGTALFGSLSAGFDRVVGPARWITYGRVEMLNADLDAYAESGSPLWALTYEARSVESLQGALGLRYEREILRGYDVWTPGARLEWTHEFGDAGSQTLRYADWLDGPGFLIGQEGWDRSRLNLGISLNWRARTGWSWSGEYDGAFSDGEMLNGLRIKGSKSF